MILEIISHNIPQYNWIYKESNGLYNICVSNEHIECIIDITFYDPYDDDDIDVDDDTSIFQYAMRKSEYPTMLNYITKLRENLDELTELNIDDKIDEIMFTTPYFEYHSCQKGIELMKSYLEKANVKWIEDIKSIKKQIEGLNKEDKEDKEYKE